MSSAAVALAPVVANIKKWTDKHGRIITYAFDAKGKRLWTVSAFPVTGEIIVSSYSTLKIGSVVEIGEHDLLCKGRVMGRATARQYMQQILPFGFVLQKKKYHYFVTAD